jgi:stage II sporulation SpoAA-like protein
VSPAVLQGIAALPVKWFIDSRTQLVVVTAEGKVTRADMEAYLQAVTGARANGYAKIFDATKGESAMTPEDMTYFAVTFRRMHAELHGPLAIVLQEDRQARLQPVLGALAAADRSLRFFTSLLAARRWIKPQAASSARNPR